jgi:hypothetical protein
MPLKGSSADAPADFPVSKLYEGKAANGRFSQSVGWLVAAVADCKDAEGWELGVPAGAVVGRCSLTTSGIVGSTAVPPR